MKILAVLFKKELKIALKVGSIYNLIFLFLMLTCLVSLGPFGQEINSSVCAFLIIQFLSTTIFSSNILQYEKSNHLLEFLMVSGQSPTTILISKMLFQWSLNVILSLIFFFLYAILSKIELKDQFFFYNLIVANSTLLTSISFLVSTISLNVNQNSSIYLIIATPLYLSFLLYNFSLINSAAFPEDMLNHWLNIKILWSFCLITVPISLFACSHLISRIE